MLDRLRNRFFGKYRGVVSDVDDVTLRIKANVPAVLGDQATGWARACVPFAGPSMGFAFLPPPAAASGSNSKAATCPCRSGPAASGTTAMNRRTPPTSVLAIVTKAGQKILFDVDGGTLTVEDGNGNTVTLDSTASR